MFTASLKRSAMRSEIGCDCETARDSFANPRAVPLSQINMAQLCNFLSLFILGPSRARVLVCVTQSRHKVRRPIFHVRAVKRLELISSFTARFSSSAANQHFDCLSHSLMAELYLAFLNRDRGDLFVVSPKESSCCTRLTAHERCRRALSIRKPVLCNDVYNSKSKMTLGGNLFRVSSFMALSFKLTRDESQFPCGRRECACTKRLHFKGFRRRFSRKILSLNGHLTFRFNGT